MDRYQEGDVFWGRGKQYLDVFWYLVLLSQLLVLVKSFEYKIKEMF